MVDLRADVLAQIEELSTLVGDLVDLSRGDAGEVVHEPVDMADVVDRSLERVRRRRNDIHFDVEVIGWQVYGDTAGLSRMALNLMDNAAKWSPPGGHVGVRLSQLDASHAELVVSDRGPGIPVQERRLVFERFYRSASARALPGSGLGLAIVKQVVLNHGGLLRIEDTDPGGQPLERRFTCCSRPSDADSAASRCDGWRSEHGHRELSGFGERYLSGISVHARNLVVQLLLKATPMPVHAWPSWPE